MAADPTGLFQELRHRKVFRVGLVYAAVGWALVEITETTFPLLALPSWAPTLVLVLVLLGFPVALVLAWAFDLTPDGVRPARPDAERTAESAAADPGIAYGGSEPAGTKGRWTVGRMATVGGVVVLAIAGAAMLLSGGDGAGGVIGNRVAVLPFEDHTGDPSLDALGLVAAEWITDGLTTIDTVQVVPTTAVAEVVTDSKATDPLPFVAQRTRAGLAVLGSFVLAGDSLEVRSQLVNLGTGRVIASMGPERSHRSRPTAALGPLRRRVMGQVVLQLKEEWDAGLLAGRTPPDYAAYDAYRTGVELFLAERYPEAIREFDRARGLDSTFWSPLLRIGTAYGNMGQNARWDSVLRLIEPHRGQLSPIERINIDWARAELRGDLPAAYRHAREWLRRTPSSPTRYLVAGAAFALNRPGETVEFLQQEPEDARIRKTWVWFHDRLAAAHHVLGKHEQELKAAREAGALFPGHPRPVVLEALALASLDRPAEAEQRAGELPLFPSDATETAARLVEVGDALGAHGHDAAATRLYERALRSWHAPGSPTTPDQHRAYADLLRRVGRLEEAAEHAALAHAGDPEDGVAHALVGLVAAQRGDRLEAERIATEVAARDDASVHGGDTYNRACIRARLGDRDRAVELLRKAHAEGQPLSLRVRHDPDLRTLDGYPPFEELIRPTG